METLNEIIKKICESSKLSEGEVKKLIQEKTEELSGLVSEEGAAYIVGRELGVSLIKETDRKLKIKNLTTGLRSVDIVGKIVKVAEVREFTKGDRSGKVLNLYVGDETGFVRMSLWDQEVDRFEMLKLGVGSVIRVTKGYTKPDNVGNPELRIGKGQLEKSDETVDVQEMKEMETVSTARRMLVSELKEGDFAEIRATFLQVFKRQNPFYEGKGERGTPEQHMVVSGILDDGTANIRVVFFRDMAEKILAKKAAEVKKILEEDKIEDFYQTLETLGKDFVFRGRVKTNQLSGSKEMVVNGIEDVNLEKEIEQLQK